MSETFTFADLFAGIGSTRLAFESVGSSCTLTSEINGKPNGCRGEGRSFEWFGFRVVAS